MSIRKLIGLQNGVQDLIVEVTPRMLTLPKTIRSFALYLEKGMQVIGRFQSDLSQTLRDNIYRFRSTPPTEFRVYNLAHSTYSWSLYSLSPESKLEILEESASFNIERTIKLYQVELLEKEREVQTSYRDKKITKQIVLDFWGRAKKQMKTFRSTQKCVFPSNNAQIQFQIEIKNGLDIQQQRLYQQQQKRQLRRTKSDDISRANSNSSNIKDTVLDPDIILQLPPYSSNLQESSNNKMGQNQENQIYYIRDPENDDKNVTSYGVEIQPEFNATVKIVNPLGEEIDADKNDISFRSNPKSESDNSSNYYAGQQPLKKFSLLSDIIQASQQGSSSYGHHDGRSSGGFKNLALRKDGTIDMIIQKQDDRTHAITKVRTLPYETHHHLVVGDQFRRAQTAQKSISDVQSQIQEQSYIESQSPDIRTPPPPPKLLQTSGDPYGKWIILSALIIIIIVMFGAWPKSRPNSSKKRNRL